MEKQHLLIIEDCEEVRENLGEILELYGYTITSAAHGREGIKACLELLPDLVLCDVKMPEMDGYAVLNLLSKNESTADIPFVFITAKTEPEEIRLGMHLGAQAYITKPFYKDELLQVIHNRLEQVA
jgi:CheY-like chemotaxis protein